jgi:hypothetical protein
MMLVDIASDGSLNVVERAVLGPRGLREVTLRLPSLTPIGGAVAQLQPQVRGLRAAVNGTAVPVTPVDGGWSLATGDSRARTVLLSYTLSNSLMQTENSDSGRALAVSVPLLAQTLREQGLPYVVRATGTTIKGVTCPGAPPAEMLCGTQDANGWTAPLPTSAAVPALLLQFDF